MDLKLDQEEFLSSTIREAKKTSEHYWKQLGVRLQVSQLVADTVWETDWGRKLKGIELSEYMDAVGKARALLIKQYNLGEWDGVIYGN